MYCYRLLLYFFCFLIAFYQNAFAQFPGYYVQHFNSENGLPNTIKGIQEDNNGFIWLATEAGLVRFDGTSFKMYDRSETGLPINRLYDIGKLADGKIFTRVQYGGYYYVTSYNTLKSISEKELFQNEKPPLPVVATADMLRIEYAKKYKSRLVGDSASPGWTNSKHSYFNAVIQEGCYYYYVSKNNRLIVADTTLSNFNSVSLALSGNLTKKNLISNLVPIFLISSNSQIFLRQADMIYKLHFSSDKKSAFATAMLDVGSIPNVMGFLQLRDSSTTIVTTVADGIYIFRKQNFTTLKINGDKDANVFYAQAPFESDGVITSKGVLMPGRFIPFEDNFFAYSILKTSNNNYYLNRREIDTFGFCLLNNNLKKISEIPLESGGVNCMCQLKDSSVWISASGKFMGRVETDHIQWYERPAKLSPDFLINTFIEASPNKFWIGGKLGLAKIDVVTHEVQLMPELINAYVRSLYEDASGVLWIGTYGSGFYAWYKNKLVAFPTDANGYLKYVHSFLPDKSGRLWMTTNNGLFVFSLKDLYDYFINKKQPPYYYYFDNTAGFLTNEFNGGCSPAGIVLGNGKFSFPSLNGLVQFFPDSIKPVSPDAKIFIDKIVADTSDITVINGKVTIPHDVSRVQFYISSPYFGDSYNQHIEYTIDKDNNQWYSLNDDNIIELSNMRKGEHSIVLRKQAGFGENNYITKKIAFAVQPAFNQTLLYKFIILAAILLCFYLLYRLRIKFLIDQKKWLEKEVSEKTKEQHALINNLETVVAELEQSKDDLQKTLMFKETLAMIITHDLQSPLRFLSNAMERMHTVHIDAGNNVKALSDELRNTSANIYHFVEDFSIWIKKVNIAGNLDVKSLNVCMLFSELEVFFSELQKLKSNKIIMQSIPEINVCSDYSC